MTKPKKKKLRPELVGIFDDLIDPNVVIESDIPEPREIARQIIMFWRKEKCDRCHRTYEGSAHGFDMMLQLEMQTPLVYFGRFFGWKYKGIRFQAIPDVGCYDHLPRQVETVTTTIRHCPRCLHTPKVIYLPQLGA